MSAETPTYLGTTTDRTNCPECHAQCWWCSQYRWIVRETGCATVYPRKGKCQQGEAAKGTACSTCDGSRQVTVTRTVTR